MIGDFNIVNDSSEHQGGNHSSYSRKFCYFSKFIFKNNLLDVGFTSSNFTWYNNQRELARL